MASKLSIESWSEQHLAPAADLLMERHRRHRVASPLLAPLESPSAARAQISALGTGDGWVALDRGAFVGYVLFGRPTNDVAWIEPAGHAARDPEVTRELYAHAARHWVASDVREHVVDVPAIDVELWPWFVSSFGVQHTWALRTSEPLTISNVPRDVRIRRAGPDDAAVAAKADVELARHLASSPIFSDRPVPTLAEAIAGQRRFLLEPRVCAVVAERNGAHLGYGEITYSRHPDLRAPTDAAQIGIIVVEEAARGHGVGRRITAALLEWARDNAHPSVLCDWRATNLESSRAFLAFGWQPAFYRLYRAIARR